MRKSRHFTLRWALVLAILAITALTLTGRVETTWAFSAFTVLVYYAITNLAALQLPPEHRLYPRFIPIAGLAACIFLAFWVPIHIWATGLALIGGGLVWHFLAQRYFWHARRKQDGLCL